MRRFIILTLLVGCSTDGANDDHSPVDPPEAVDPDVAAKDREECKLANVAAKCPLGWGWSVRSGPPDEDDKGFVELEDVAEPICNGQGLYAEPEEFVDTPGGPEVTVVRNSQCTAVCFPQCSFTNVCYVENPDGRACGDACTPPGLTKEACEAFVAECLGDTAACDDA